MNPNNNIYIVAGSIIFAGILIAGAVIYSNNSVKDSGLAQADGNLPRGNNNAIELPSLRADDHILGDANAPVKLIEYSDIDCPFCTRFHLTMMEEIKPKYIDSGQVAWIYRHNPLTQLHPDAAIKAQATECVANLGGNNKFWEYLDILFIEEESASELAELATGIGIDESAFTDCLRSDTYKSKINSEGIEASRAGASGTPYSVVITESGEYLTIPGALPANSIEQILDQALAK